MYANKYKLVTWYTQYLPPITLGEEIFASRNVRKFHEFCPNSRKFKRRKILYWPIHESLCTRNFSIFYFFSPNLLAALDNA